MLTQKNILHSLIKQQNIKTTTFTYLNIERGTYSIYLTMNGN